MVVVDFNGIVTTNPQTETTTEKPDESSGTGAASTNEGATATNENKDPGHSDKDDVFSDSETEENGSSKSKRNRAASTEGATSESKQNTKSDQVASLVHSTEQVSLGNANAQQMHATSEPRKDAPASDVQVSSSESEFRAMAADASVFSFGDEDYESE